jgi:hypothetical protein
MMIVGTRPPTWHTALCICCSRVHGLRSMTAMVKVFGCRPSPVARLGMGPAYENRPSTNPRGCSDGLWGFRVLLGCGDGGTGWALEPARAW